MKHRRIISFLSAAVMGITAMAILPGTLESTEIIAEAKERIVGEYRIDDYKTNKIKIVKYLGNSEIVSIPDNLEGKTVEGIAPNAFKGKAVKEVTIPPSVTSIGNAAFVGCTALTNVSLNENITFGKSVFTGCKALKKVNGFVPWTTDSYGKPIFIDDSTIQECIKNCFIQNNDDIGFINDYCDALCSYIVNTETRSWMSDMLKARQLHDWLIRHCQYEDQKNGERLDDPENQNCSGLFVSYAFGTRGEEIGESVCTGYSKAFQKLLAKCGIESELLYELGNDTRNNEALNHVWNLVKIGRFYYHCDVTQDNNLTDASNMAYGTHYSGFMRSTYDMYSVHLAQNSNYHTINDITTNSAKKALNNCSSNSMQDQNQDGILDGDWSFDGTANRRDGDYYRALYLMMNNCLGQDIRDEGVDYMPVYISILKDLGWSPDYLYNTFG